LGDEFDAAATAENAAPIIAHCVLWPEVIVGDCDPAGTASACSRPSSATRAVRVFWDWSSVKPEPAAQLPVLVRELGIPE
jgi:hypothetical protein